MTDDPPGRAVIDRAAAMLDDAMGTPGMLDRIAGEYGLQGGPLSALPGDLATRRIVLSGLGSSRYAALDAATDLRASGVAAWAEPASLEQGSPPGQDTVLVAISASGRTPETVAAAGRHRGTSFVVAVTNEPDSPLAATADVVLPLLAGTEGSGVSCRSHPATAAVLALVVATAVARPGQTDRIRRAAADRHALLERHTTWSAGVADQLEHADAIGVIADATVIGGAGQAALMLREAPRCPAVAHEAGDWLHTAIYTALPGYRAVLLGSSAYDAELVATVSRRGGSVVGIGAAPGTAAAVRAREDPLVLGVVLDVTAAVLWSRLDGLVQGHLHDGHRSS